ncbi:vWA domain-containing protein [Amycolatopsis sp. VC5-11]|uniref:vWA domain-containing protein n=1 Tax=Amycolatopsis sp. VC5-11 TaxID=3120156 RepID=UPI00300865A8
MYTAEVNRAQPACLMLLIDQSYSMSEPWSQATMSKAAALATAVNNVLATSVVLCTKGGRRVVDYFQVGALGYSDIVSSLFENSTVDEPLRPVSALADKPRRVEKIVPDPAQPDEFVVQPVWVDTVHGGRTAMTGALAAAEKAVSAWCADHPDSFPPIVINLTDGMATDGDPLPAAQRIQALGTNDGPALLLNVHLSRTGEGRINFPGTAASLPDKEARLLFEMSSELPTPMAEAASSFGYDLVPGARGFLYNADPSTVVQFLDIGTRGITPGGFPEITDGQ